MDNHFFSNVSLPLLLTVYSDEERTSLEQYVTQLPGLICIFRAWISLPALKTTTRTERRSLRLQRHSYDHI